MNDHKEEEKRNNTELQTSAEHTPEPTDQPTPNSVVVHQSFSGPLPPPSALIQYNHAHPDAAERIIAMSEKQQAHRHKLEAKVVGSDNFRASFGLVLGASIAVTALWMAYRLIMNDKTAEGLATVLIALGAPVGAFIYAHSRKTRDLEEKGDDSE